MWIRLRRNWFRNLLAVLQVALAIAAVSAALVDVVPMLTPGEQAGVSTYVARFGAQGGNMTVYTSTYYPEDATYLVEHATAVEAASAFAGEFQTVIMVDGQRWMVRAQAAVHPAFARLVDLELLSGTFFTEQDTRGAAPRVAVVSEDLARTLFGTADVLGRTINLRPREESFLARGFSSARTMAELAALPGDDVEIIGVYKVRGDAFMTFGIGQAADLLLPIMMDTSAAAQQRLSEILYRPRPGMDREAEEEVRQLLMSRLAERGEADQILEGMRADVFVEPVLGAAQLQRVSATSLLLTGGLGLAALAVSSIAMFTTTLANLAPRIRYIGLGRALGATRARIVREVVAESALLAGIGGVLGVALAFPLRSTVLAPLFSSATAGDDSGFVTILLVGLAGVALAVVVGAVAALYPAWTVARLAPAEAWREGAV